jgi:adenylate kinase
MDAGHLVTDEIVIGLIEEKLTTVKASGFIFDGFPRTLKQADALGDLLARMGQKIDLVIEMQVDDDVLVERVSGRATCGTCGEVYHDTTKPIPSNGKCTKCGGTAFKRRPDDNAESLRTRLWAYYKQTAPLIGYYYAKGLLTSVDGLAEIPDVAKGIRAALTKT